jgi:hypothetical protein
MYLCIFWTLDTRQRYVKYTMKSAQRQGLRLCLFQRLSGVIESLNSERWHSLLRSDCMHDVDVNRETDAESAKPSPDW